MKNTGMTINEKNNPLLVLHFLSKIENDVKNIASWIPDMNGTVAEKIRRITDDAIKNIEQIKQEIQPTEGATV
jgi:gas vesicle protein